MKNLYFLVNLMIGLASIVSAQEYDTSVTTEQHQSNYNSEIQMLEDKIITMHERQVDVELEIDRVQTLAEARRQAINKLEEIIDSKDAYIEALQLTLQATESLLEKEQLWNAEIEELRSKDSIRNEIIVAEKDKDIERLRQLFSDAQRSYRKQMDRLYSALFEISFKVTAMQRDKTFGKVINDKLPLNPSNSMEVRARLVEQMFIEFKTARRDAELPDYTFSMVYKSRKGKTKELFKNFPLETNNGEVNYKIDWTESQEKKFKPGKGSYTLILKFEENQKMIVKKYEFTLG